jgi:hypothetical protein
MSDMRKTHWPDGTPIVWMPLPPKNEAAMSEAMIEPLKVYIKNFGGPYQGEEAFKECHLKADVDALREQLATVTQQLATARQQVWEEAANKCHECLDMTRNDQIVWAQEHLKEMLHGRCQAFANLESWCREQAKEAQP